MTNSYISFSHSCLFLFKTLSSFLRIRLLFSIFISILSALMESFSIALLIPITSLIVDDTFELPNNFQFLSSYIPVDLNTRIVVLLSLFIFAYLLSVSIRLFNVYYITQLISTIGKYLASFCFSRILSVPYVHRGLLTFPKINTYLTAVPTGTSTFIDLFLNLVASFFISISVVVFLILYNPLITLTFWHTMFFSYVSGLNSRRQILMVLISGPCLIRRGLSFGRIL